MREGTRPSIDKCFWWKEEQASKDLKHKEKSCKKIRYYKHHYKNQTKNGSRSWRHLPLTFHVPWMPLIQKLTGTIDRGGKTDIIIEEILQVSASQYVGKEKSQARQ